VADHLESHRPLSLGRHHFEKLRFGAWRQLYLTALVSSDGATSGSKFFAADISMHYFRRGSFPFQIHCHTQLQIQTIDVHRN